MYVYMYNQGGSEGMRSSKNVFPKLHSVLVVSSCCIPYLI